MNNALMKSELLQDRLEITPSADDILGVSPVNSPSEEALEAISPSGGIRPRRSNNEDAFSSSSGSDYSESEDDECEDYSEDEDDNKSANITSAKKFSPSEFDKALMTGVASRGHASSFFSAESIDGSDCVIKDSSRNSKKNNKIKNKSKNKIKNKNNKTDLHPSSSTNQGLRPPESASVKNNHRSFKNLFPNRSGTGGNTAGEVSASSTVSASKTGMTKLRPHPVDNSDNLSSGVLPDVLMTMRQKIESLTLFDSDMIKMAAESIDHDLQETRESLKRSSQQSISAAVLVSLAHKRYERRRLAAMEIEKVVRSLVQQTELERVRAILLLLSDDYVRSTSEDARKGGVVALAACAIGLKKAIDADVNVMECRDLILASVVHACQDHSQRVRYYATESLFNVVKVIPGLAVQHFFILFEILRSLYADVDVDVRSGAELLDKKLKEVIVGAMNSGSFSADACVPVFARFVYMRNKATKRLTLTWLQELNEKLIGAPILEFLHLFLGGIFGMVADPSVAIRQSALAFLQSVLPKLLVINSEAIDDMDDQGMKVDFDKILQSLVTTMEHPDHFVRKVAMYWMSRIVKAHMGELYTRNTSSMKADTDNRGQKSPTSLTAASISVRNSLPHVLPGILLSIGDTFHSRNATKDSFLPDQTTHSLAEQTNACLQEAIRRDGEAYVQHLDGFIVALREELDSPGGLSARYPQAEERNLYRIDVNRDGTGIESPGWFRASNDMQERTDAVTSSRLCALHWIIVLYESVVPDILNAIYAREFIIPIIHQLIDNPPGQIVYKSIEVLAKITVPVFGEDSSTSISSGSLSGLNTFPPSWASGNTDEEEPPQFPMTDANIAFALDILSVSSRKLKSRDREVFSALIQLHSSNHQLLTGLSRVIAFMCRLQPSEFVFVSFAVELDRFVRRRKKFYERKEKSNNRERHKQDLCSDLTFVSSFVQQMNHVLLNSNETKDFRDTLRDCVGLKRSDSQGDRRRVGLFHILLHSFSHSLVSTVSFCLWGGAYRTASMFLNRLVPLDINLMFLLELDKLVEMLERPLFRHLHVRMLECYEDTVAEASGAMLFQTLKLLLMILPQSTCYNVLKKRLVSISRFRQSASASMQQNNIGKSKVGAETELFVSRVLHVRALHCDAMWQNIRAESLECPPVKNNNQNATIEEGTSRREWLGFSSKEEEQKAEETYREEKNRLKSGSTTTHREENTSGEYHNFNDDTGESVVIDTCSTNNNSAPKIHVQTKQSPSLEPKVEEETKDDLAWKDYWTESND